MFILIAIPMCFYFIAYSIGYNDYGQGFKNKKICLANEIDFQPFEYDSDE